MKKLTLLLILIYPALLFADQGGRQAADYAIKGYKLGESLLDHHSKNEIKKNRVDWYDDVGDGEFTASDFSNSKGSIQITYQVNDDEYIIQRIDNTVVMSYGACKKKMKTEIEVLKKIFINARFDSIYTNTHWADKSGKSKYTQIDIFLKSEDIVNVSCTDWSNKVNWRDHYRVNIGTKIVSEWLISNT